MPEDRISLIVDETRDPVEDIAIGPALLRHVVSTGGGAVLRLYRPAPTVAFSGRDCVTPGIVDAARAASGHGFAPVRRGPGGRAAAYHPGALGLDHVSPERESLAAIRSRFADYGELLAGALRTVGVPAAVGEVPGEYCPGEFSVNDGYGHKLIGTAQRLIPGGWLFSAIILVTDADSVARVLDAVYPALGLSYDSATVGAVHDLVPTVGVDDIQGAVLLRYAERAALIPAAMPAAVVAAAKAARGRHLVPAA